MSKHMVVCKVCGRRFDASNGGFYDAASRRYICKKCGKAHNRAVKEVEADRREAATGMRQKPFCAEKPPCRLPIRPFCLTRRMSTSVLNAEFPVLHRFRGIAPFWADGVWAFWKKAVGKRKPFRLSVGLAVLIWQTILQF